MQRIFLLLLFIVNNRDQYKLNSDIHSINTRHDSNLYHQLSNLTTYEKGTYYCGIKIFNNLPSGIKKFSHKSFYTLDEYFNSTKVQDLVLICKYDYSHYSTVLMFYIFTVICHSKLQLYQRISSTMIEGFNLVNMACLIIIIIYCSIYNYIIVLILN